MHRAIVVDDYPIDRQVPHHVRAIEELLCRVGARVDRGLKSSMPETSCTSELVSNALM